ncbi:MAG TPA: DciA family protein [Rubrivivax sp.]|nr:DciA family protein [Rubrivivax sp.]
MAQKSLFNQVPLDAALRDCEPLTGLLQRVRQSQALLDALLPLLPVPLRPLIQAGPLDDAGWSLLVANSAAAAKLRQMLPQLKAELQHFGHPVAEIRLRVRRGGR